MLFYVCIQASLVLGAKSLAVANHGQEIFGVPLRGVVVVIVIVIVAIVWLWLGAGSVVGFKVRHGDRSRMRGSFRVVIAGAVGGTRGITIAEGVRNSGTKQCIM